MVEIEVTAEHIELGERWNCRRCPIAHAINTALGRMCDVKADVVEIDGEWFELPKKARNFVADFDAGFSVLPFSFTLDYPKS